MWEGFGYGTIDGNGQAWYDFVDGENNYPGRPHGITIFAEDSTIKGLRFVQSQMWCVETVARAAAPSRTDEMILTCPGL